MGQTLWLRSTKVYVFYHHSLVSIMASHVSSCTRVKGEQWRWADNHKQFTSILSTSGLGPNTTTKCTSVLTDKMDYLYGHYGSQQCMMMSFLKYKNDIIMCYCGSLNYKIASFQLSRNQWRSQDIAYARAQHFIFPLMMDEANHFRRTTARSKYSCTAVLSPWQLFHICHLSLILEERHTAFFPLHFTQSWTVHRLHLLPLEVNF